LSSGGTDYDVKLIYPILEKIGASPATSVIEDALFEELLGEEDSIRLAIFARLLARRSLESWDADHLKDLPKKTLTESFVSLLLVSHKIWM
jgi:hypothetical protein